MDAERIVLQVEAILTRDFGANSIAPENIYAWIPTAIKVLQDKLLRENPEKLENFRSKFVVQAHSGRADLSSATNSGLRLDLINRATVRVDNPENPQIATVQMVESFERFNGNSIQDAFCVLGFLDGSNLLIRDGAANDKTTSFNKRLNISAIGCPLEVDEIADELEGDLIQILGIIGKQEIPQRRRNVDVAEQKT